MAYTPPQGDNISFDFTAAGYEPPGGTAVAFEFGSVALPVVVTPAGSPIRILPGSPMLPILPAAGVLQVAPHAPVVNLPQHVQVTRAQILISLVPPPIRATAGTPGALGLFLDSHAPAKVATRVSSTFGAFHLVGPEPSIFGGRGVRPGTAIIIIEGRAPTAVMRLEPTPGVVMRVSTGGVGWVWSADTSLTQVVYRFTLTGSIGQVVIPISSIQGRLRDGKPTYLSVVIPSIDYAPDVSARSDGEMIIDRGYRHATGDATWQEIARADLDSIRTDKGAKNTSITLVGYATTSNDAPKTVSLSGVSYRSVGADGKRRYRCALNMFLRPGDTAVIHGESFTVGSITYTIDTKTETMEIVEA